MKRQGETDIFIDPGYAFKRVGAMLTDFHLPQSSLLLLVCAFGGTELMLDAYPGTRSVSATASSAMAIVR
jgi:S-adenosylmethionine:tRNA ribosyltransferase-isomerase